MMNKKKLVSLILSVPLAFSFVSASVFADEPEHMPVHPMKLADKTTVSYPRRVISIKGEPYDVAVDPVGHKLMKRAVEIPKYELKEDKATVQCEYGITLNVSRDPMNGSISYGYGEDNVAITTFERCGKTFFYAALSVPYDAVNLDGGSREWISAESKTPTPSGYVASRKGKKAFKDSNEGAAILADENNHVYLEALRTQTDATDARRILPCKVVYTPEAKIERAHTGKVYLYKGLDILRAALLSAEELKIPNDKVLVVDAASSKTPGGGPFNTGTAAEESICRSSALYLSLGMGSMDEFYNDVQGNWFTYNPYKYAIAKSVPVFVDPRTGVVGKQTIESVLKAPTVDFIVRASRNLNPGVGTDYLPSLPDSRFYSEMRKPVEERKSEIIDPVSAQVEREIREEANQMVLAAVNNGYKLLVVNNLGGGVFRNGVSVWANAFADAIKTYGGDLNVVFTIYEDKIKVDGVDVEVEMGKNKNVDAFIPTESPVARAKKNSQIYFDVFASKGIALVDRR